MRRTYRKRSREELEEIQRAMDADRQRVEEEAKAEEERQAKARQDFIDTAAKTRRCSRRPNLG